MYDRANPGQLLDMGMNSRNEYQNRLNLSLQNPVVQIPINVHLDDASMNNSKVWKSGSAVTIQIAGAPHGHKGGESNNMLLALTPTMNISLKRLFDTVIEDLVLLQDEGFDAYDMYTMR